MTDLDAVAYAVGRYAAATADLGTALMDLDVPWEAAALLLDQITRAREDTQKAEALLERHIIQQRRAAGVRGDVEIDGVGVVNVRRTTDRKHWDHEAVASAVVDAHLSGGDGEVPDPWDVRDWIMAAVGPAYWRVGALKALRLRPGDYCEEVKGREVVQIIRSGS